MGNIRNDNDSLYDVIVIGGSYAGLSAALALGRSLRKILVIDDGNPCNIKTPRSHNFLTHDGEKPTVILDIGKKEVMKYDSVRFIDATALHGTENKGVYTIDLDNGESFSSGKLIFATGIIDKFPDIKGFSNCWGISVLHCPYCHGFEVRNKRMGVLGNGEIGFDLAKLISNWTNDLVLFTNGVSSLSEKEYAKLNENNILVIEKEISHVIHENGYMSELVFKDGSSEQLNCIFAKLDFKQSCEIPIELGCEINSKGYINVDEFQRTNVQGIFAAGDNTTFLRSVSVAVAAGNVAGGTINKELINQSF